MRATLAFAAGLLATTLAPRGWASEIIFARALGGPPSAELVAYVAGAAETRTYKRGTRLDLEALTARQLAVRECGSLPLGYLGLAGVADTEVDTVLGTRVYDISWPACLYATSLSEGGRRYTMRDGDIFSFIWQQFTGGGAVDNNDWSIVAAASHLNRAKSEDLKINDTILVPVTTPTRLVAKKNLTLFEQGLKDKKLLGKVKVYAASSVGGEILTPVYEGPSGSIANENLMACDGGPPFDPGLIALAFSFTQTVVQTGLVTVAVVDNGFFGVKCDENGDCPAVKEAFSDVFPERFFHASDDWEPQGGIGPKVMSFEAINYLNLGPTGEAYTPAYINADSGHGTHVAGLVLGGPTFRRFRSTYDHGLDPSGQPRSWMKLAIINVAGGASQIQADAYKSVINELRTMKERPVANMSLVFSGAGNDFETLLRNAMEAADNVVFVVAAGNQGEDLALADALPARLSTASDNIITVASIDATRRLSIFSNYSATLADIAAPGCKLDSWLSASEQTFASSGTSTAAPVVSFTAALMRGLWAADPVEIKNRLGVSGEYIDDLDCKPDGQDDRHCVVFATALNPWKALLITTDVVTTSDGPNRRYRLGRLSIDGEIRCKNKVIPAPVVRAIKRRGDGTFEIYYAPHWGSQMQRCVGQIRATSPGTPPLSMVDTNEAEAAVMGPDGAEAQPARIRPATGSAPVDVATLQDVVFRSKN